MAYETLLKLRQMVANRRNKTNENSSDVVRDNAINDACKLIYNESRWSWLKQRTTISVSAGVASLPGDYNPNFGLSSAYSAVTGTANDKPYLLIEPEDADLYTTADYVYWINYSSVSEGFVFNSNQTTDTVTIVYFYQPDEFSSDLAISPIPDPWAIVWLATALWWSATEHEQDLLNSPFYPKYLERIAAMKTNDAAYNKAPRPLRSSIDNLNLPGQSTLMTRR